MFSSKDFSNKLVISVTDGRKLGEIKGVYLDLDMHMVVGIYLGTEGIIKRKEKAILRTNIQVCGIDAWLVTNSDVVVNLDSIPDFTTFNLVDNLRGREIQTEGGTRLGEVEDVLLDTDLKVLGFVLGRVHVQGPLSEKMYIVRDAVTDVGSKDRAMIVDLNLAEAGTIPSE